VPSDSLDADKWIQYLVRTAISSIQTRRLPGDTMLNQYLVRKRPRSIPPWARASHHRGVSPGRYACRLFMAVVISIEIALVVTAAVPTVVVGDLTAVGAVPVAFIEPLSIMTGFNPTRTAVRRTGPISVVPLIAMTNRIPIPAYPGVVGSGTSRLNPDHPRRRRRADSDSDGKLGERRSRR
jgi:hypothetical protein